MLAFDPNEYRQRLNLALGLRDPKAIGANPAAAPAAKIENPYDTEEQPAPQPQQQQQPQQGGGNLAAIAQGAMGAMGGGQGQGASMPNLGGMAGGAGQGPDTGIDESGAMGQQPPQAKFPMGENGKIDTRPPDLDVEGVDEEKLGKANTIDEVFDAAPAKTQNEYMKWWEGAYGSINQKYDRMRSELGQYQELPKKLSRKQMFVLLLGYGARMASNMRGGRDVDPMAASDDAFQFGQDTVMGNKMPKDEYQQNLGAIEGGRAAELKGLGSKGDAMEKASEIDLRGAQADNLGRAQGERFTAEDGKVYIVGKDGTAKPVTGPDGKQLHGSLPVEGGRNSEFERAKASYIEAHGVDADGKKLTGAAYQKVLQAANDFARYGSRQKDEDGTSVDDLRQAARDRVNTIVRSSPDTFRDLDPDELGAQLAKMEEEEFSRLKRTNLGSSPIHDGPRARAPARSEAFVKSHPEALEDFVSDYGYVPEGMEQHVTPAIKKRMGM